MFISIDTAQKLFTYSDEKTSKLTCPIYRRDTFSFWFYFVYKKTVPSLSSTITSLLEVITVHAINGKDTSLRASILWVSLTVFKSMRNPLPLLETMETIDTVFTVWQTALSSSPTPFALRGQRLCTHVDKRHTLPTYIPVIPLTGTFSAHRSTQCLTFS